MRTVIRISREEAVDAKAAKKLALERIAPYRSQYKYTSTQRNSEGWSICFKRVNPCLGSTSTQ